MPNMMVALPNIGGALYSTPQSQEVGRLKRVEMRRPAKFGQNRSNRGGDQAIFEFYKMPCSNAAKTRNQLKCGGVPQTNETLSR